MFRLQIVKIAFLLACFAPLISIAQTNDYPPTGNVGIGTLNPTKDLEINGGDGIGIRLFNTNANSWDILNAQYGKLDFVRGGTNIFMRIDQSGNVGIGTTSPGKKMEISGGDGVGIRLRNTNANSWDILNSLNGTLDFVRGGTNTFMRIDQVGNVGFGTTSPSYNLEVKGTGERVIGIHSEDSQTRLHFRKNNTSQDGAIIYHTDGRLGFHLDNSGAAAWETNEFMTINNSGNVGIGTTSPLSVLQVELPEFTSRDTDNQQVVFSNSNDNNYGIRFGFNGTSGKGYINVLNPAVAWGDLVLQDGGGKVLIGQTTGTEKVEVNGNIKVSTTGISDRYVTSQNQYREFRAGVTGYDYTIQDINDGETWLRVDGNTNYMSIGKNNALSIDQNNKVGIGTTSPGGMLDIRLGGWNNFPRVVFKQTTDNPSIRLYRPSGTGTTAYPWWIENKKDLSFKSGVTAEIGSEILTDIMTLKSTGNVGIGTTTPDSKLAVNGNIHTKEVKVDLIGWSDFVFYEDYNLPTLQEVENHIIEKGHLKDIPSANEVEENGILLGEMNAKLLQKIEELTLYTIKQQKLIDEQSKSIEIQSEAIKELQKDLKVLKND